jgi:hypothetical protein
LSDDEEDDSLLSETNVMAVSEVTSDEGDDDDSRSLLLEETSHSSMGCCCEQSSMMMVDLSVDNVIRSSSRRSQLMSLLEQNQRALQSLVTVKDDLIFHSCLDEQEVKASTSTKESSSWSNALEFELRHSLPGCAALVLYCIAHASTYELISNVAYEAVERGDSDTENDSDCSKTRLYTVLMVLGCLVARYSGLVWDFVGPTAYRRVKFIYHNRVRCGAMDARGLYWLQQQGEAVGGCVNIVAYYMCYIGVVHFVQELAIYCDQSDEILARMPSNLYEKAVKTMVKAAVNTTLYLCPAFDLSPDALFGNQTFATPTLWDPLACDYNMWGEEVEIFGPQDDQYFFEKLSRNSYDHFFGQYFETPLFDSTHHLLFYAALATLAMVSLKTFAGYAFWAGW